MEGCLFRHFIEKIVNFRSGAEIMKLHSLGIDFHHDKDFLIDRPEGSGDDLIIIFKSPAVILQDGVVRSVPADSAVVYSRGERQYYGAAGAEYINHWVHFECDERDAFFDRIGLPFNRVIPVSASGTEDILNLLNIEQISNVGVENREECVDLLLRLLLAKLGGAEGSPRNNPHSAALRSLRAEIYRAPADCKSIAELSARLALSPSYFQNLYKREFGVSCYEDVLAARLERAKYYLSDTSLSVRRIAELCGFENDTHFMRQFRRRTGITATQYRGDIQK